jgi:phosphonopyruvate decarboxylase
MIDRHVAIRTLLEHVADRDALLTTTGMISREVFATRDRPGTFYMIGSMGLLSGLGLGLALALPGRRVWVLEGDGSALMSLGTLSLIAAEAPKNLVHVILDNEAYESTGGQPSVSCAVDLARVAESCGYRRVARAAEPGALDDVLGQSVGGPGPHMIVAKIGLSNRDPSPRVSREATEIRDRFRNWLFPLR